VNTNPLRLCSRAALAALAGLATWGAVPAPAKDTPFGVTLTPAHHPFSTQADTVAALFEAAQVGGHVSLSWEWRRTQAELFNLAVVLPAARAAGLKTFLQFSSVFLGEPAPPPGLPPTFSNPTVQALYLDAVTQVARLKPDYLNLNPEINLTYRFFHNEFIYYSYIYKISYNIVKQISPATQVGVSYQLDLFYSDREAPLINALGPQDFVGFTTYPSGLVYSGVYPSLDAIPGDYYTRLRTIVPDKPIVFSEVGWTSGGRGNLVDQASFVKRLPGLMAGVSPALVCWAALHDTAYFQLGDLTPAQLAVLRTLGVDPNVLLAELNATGLYFWDGSPKPSLLGALLLDFGPNTVRRPLARPLKPDMATTKGVIP
jgi:hypothetical protein